MVFLKPCLKLLLVGSILCIIYVISEASLDSADEFGGVLILIGAVPYAVYKIVKFFRDDGMYVNMETDTMTEIPGVSEAYRPYIETLLMPDQLEDIVIQNAGGPGFVQLSRNGTDILVNISQYPSSEHPARVLADAEINMPHSASLEEWHENFCAIYRISSADSAEISTFIHELFVKLYNNQDGYQVNVSSMEWNPTAQAQ
ncbi:MAG: hypothetical protein AMK71_06215 [Nitrospira bacterium SG8_35_4]|nr:MAG: hypothetical protein AMK71_06215 [Nitrospira bacterium SG8_35_4]